MVSCDGEPVVRILAKRVNALRPEDLDVRVRADIDAAPIMSELEAVRAARVRAAGRPAGHSRPALKCSELRHSRTAQPNRAAVDSLRMQTKPVLVIPKSAQVSQMLETEPLSIEPRAQRIGIVVVAPRTLRPADLMVACHFWPKVLRPAGVSRVAVVLGLETYLNAEPILRGCQRRMKEQGVIVEYFHEAHLESDQIDAWFEQRRPRRRVTTDALMRLSERYAARGDIRTACHAVRLAETVMARDTWRCDESVAAEQRSLAATRS